MTTLLRKGVTDEDLHPDHMARNPANIAIVQRNVNNTYNISYKAKGTLRVVDYTLDHPRKSGTQNYLQHDENAQKLGFHPIAPSFQAWHLDEQRERCRPKALCNPDKNSHKKHTHIHPSIKCSAGCTENDIAIIDEYHLVEPQPNNGDVLVELVKCAMCKRSGKVEGACGAFGCRIRLTPAGTITVYDRYGQIIPYAPLNLASQPRMAPYLIPLHKAIPWNAPDTPNARPLDNQPGDATSKSRAQTSGVRRPRRSTSDTLSPPPRSKARGGKAARRVESPESDYIPPNTSRSQPDSSGAAPRRARRKAETPAKSENDDANDEASANTPLLVLSDSDEDFVVLDHRPAHKAFAGVVVPLAGPSKRPILRPAAAPLPLALIAPKKAATKLPVSEETKQDREAKEEWRRREARDFRRQLARDIMEMDPTRLTTPAEAWQQAEAIADAREAKEKMEIH